MQPKGANRPASITIGSQGRIRHIMAVARIARRVEHRGVTANNGRHEAHIRRLGRVLRENDTGHHQGACESHAHAVQNGPDPFHVDGRGKGRARPGEAPRELRTCMAKLIPLLLGIVIFLGMHAFSRQRAARDALIASKGEPFYKMLYSLVSVMGFALIVYGYGHYRSQA